MEILQNIKLDFGRDTMPLVVFAKQYDSDTRKIAITPLNNGAVYTIPSGVTARLHMTKKDGTIIIDDAEIADNIITVTLTAQALTAAGMATAEIGLYDNDELLTTQAFYIDVKKSAYDPDAAESTSEFRSIINICNGKVNYRDLTADPDPDAPSSDPVKFATDPQTIYRANLKNPNNSSTSSNDVVCVKGSSLMSQYRIDTRGHVYTRSAGVAADPQWGDWAAPVNLVPSTVEVAGYALTGNVTPKMISDSMYENILSDPVNGQTSTTGLSGFKGKIVRSQASGRFFICYNTAASEDDPYLYWQAIPNAPQIWDYNTALQNNFSVPTNYAGQLGDIIIMTTAATGKGGAIWMLFHTVSAYGTTTYNWRELATKDDVAAKADRYVSVANATVAALENIPRGQFFECQGNLCYRTLNGYRVVSWGSEIIPSN